MPHFYALRQHTVGTMTTINGKSADYLHRFENRAERDAWVEAHKPRAHAVPAQVAAQLSQEIYGVPLGRLTTETFDPFGDEALPESAEYGALRVDQ